ncbi:HNH endonuclease [Thalassospira sp. MCCC 1A02803]|nr:HNH endonuclease [Thalassospira sp. MCCC 1A02803]ONH85370.1 HNH endonuclease [Thalassospira sp. MCCC 1A02803]
MPPQSFGGDVMPNLPTKPCAVARCGTLTRERYCEKHQAEHRKRQDERRGTAAKRGYGSKWQKARAAFLREHPLCCQCQNEGYVVAATEVDHIIPHKGDQKLFWSRSNWQSLCKTHHSIKTAKEDGGFGHR